jgi:hypothetical protein
MPPNPSDARTHIRSQHPKPLRAYLSSTPEALDNYVIGSIENGVEGGQYVGWNSDSLRLWTSF